MAPFPARAFRLLLFAALAAMTGGQVAACGADTDCTVAGGSYRIALPETGGGEASGGAIIFLHGYGGSPEDVMGFAALRDVAERLDVALVAPRGEDKSWNLPGAMSGERDDVAFIDGVARDAVSRFRVDPNRILVSGFSVGASMVWYVACAEGRRYAGYAPIAGAFWEPYVESCRLPLPTIRHVHGTADETVPLEGRKLRVATQGNVFRSFELLRRFSQCTGDLADADAEGDLTCQHQTCGGSEQDLCLHSGGHVVRPEWIEEAWRQVFDEGASH